MKIKITALLLMLVTLLSGCQTMNRSQQSALMNLVEQQLIPYLDANLVNKARFLQRPIIIVKLERGQIASDMDPLTAAIRERLETYLLQQQKIMLYRSDMDLADMQETSQASACVKRPELFLGIELKVSGTEYTVSLRMLDKQQNNRWVEGFGLSKAVQLTAEESTQLMQVSPDPWLRGFRESPYTATEMDLLVKDMGRQLKCQFMKQMTPASLSLDFTEAPQSNEFKRISQLLKSDLPVLTGIPLSLVKKTEKKTGQLILSLRWVMLDKQKGMGRLALTATQTEQSRLIPIGAWVYVTGLNIKPVQQSTLTANSGDVNLPAIILTRETSQRASNDSTTKPIIQSVTMEVPDDLSLCAAPNPWRHGMHQYSGNVLLPREACIRLNMQLTKPAWLYIVSHSSTQSWNRLFPVKCLNRLQLPDMAAYTTQKLLPAATDAVQTLQMDGPAGSEKVLVFAITNRQQAQDFEQFLNQIPDACAGEQYLSPAYQQNLLDSFKRIAPEGDLKILKFNRF